MNKTSISPSTINGVEVTKTSGKFVFKARLQDGTDYEMIQSGRIGSGKAELVAKAIGASIKRGYKGVILDPMAKGQIRRIVAAKTFKGINFSQSTTPRYELAA